MQLEHNQPAGNGLREALAPWFDHSAAWLVLLCIGLTIFAALAGYTAGQHGNALATLFTAHGRDARRDVRRLARIHAARAAIRATQGLALARSRPRRGTRRDPRGSGDARIRHSPAADGRRPPAVRFLPLRRDGGDGPAVLDARQVVRAAVLARGDARRALRRHRALARAAARLADGRAACARLVDRRARRRDRRARRAAPAAPRGLAGLAGARRLLARAPRARRRAPAGSACRGSRHAVGLCRSAASLRDRGLRSRRASRLPAQRAPRAADGRGGAGLAVRAAHALCGLDARRLCTPDAAQGQFRRARRPHRLGRLHLRGPPVRPPGDCDRRFRSRSRPASRRALPKRASTP